MPIQKTPMRKPYLDLEKMGVLWSIENPRKDSKFLRKTRWSSFSNRKYVQDLLSMEVL